MPDFTVSEKLILHYLDENLSSPKVVLLLHGLGATSSSWALQIPGLIDAGFRVLAPDARGFGKSTFLGGRTSIAQMSGDFVSLLSHLNVTSTSVVGISMGGTHALQLALDYPSLVAKLVLVNTFASLRPRSLKVWLYFAIRFGLVLTLGIPAQAKAVAMRLFPNPDQEDLRKILIGQILEADPRAYRAAMRALARFNVVHRLREINIPTLVITGLNDTTVPPQNQRFLVDNIRDADHVVIPNAGHAVIVEQPQVFNQVLYKFLMDSHNDPSVH